MSNHHLLLDVQLMIATLQLIMERAHDLERQLLEEQTLDEVTAPTASPPSKSPASRKASRRGPLRFSIAAEAVALTCFACQREVLQQPGDDRLLDADGTEHSQTCRLRHIMGSGQQTPRAQSRPTTARAKKAAARKRAQCSVP